MKNHKYYNRCVGHCCTEIALSVSPDQLRESYENFLRRGQTSIGMGQVEPTSTYYNDIHLIYPMLKFIKQKNGHPENRRSKVKNYWYSCKHFDDKKKECSIYEIRPQMCRTYPDAAVCSNSSCQWKGVAKSWVNRNKNKPRREDATSK